MFASGTLTFREFMTREPHPLAMIQAGVLEFLRGRTDVVVFGAQAVNAYVDEARMTQDFDLLSAHARELAEELRHYLRQRFHIALRIREVAEGRGYRVYQARKSGNRHLADLRSVEHLPPFHRLAAIQVLAPAELIASKVISYHSRKGKPKAGTDWRDLAMLLLRFPDMKRHPGPVTDCLNAAGVKAVVLAQWKKIAAEKIIPSDEDEEFF